MGNAGLIDRPDILKLAVRFWQRCYLRATVSREQIMGLTDSFSRVLVSDRIPLWHFLCER